MATQKRLTRKTVAEEHAQRVSRRGRGSSAAIASGSIDTLPHNGAVISPLSVTGMTHRQFYKDIFAITCIKTIALFVVIGIYYATGMV
jgi:H+/gluconate symporter-like permease